MSAPTRTPPHPATSGGVDIRLPWWAMALPALAFISLLVLMANPTDAHATASDPAITQLFQRLQQLTGR